MSYPQVDDDLKTGSTSSTAARVRAPNARSWNAVLPSLTETALKEALFRYVRRHTGCNKNFVKQMKLSEPLATEGVYVYKLETFGEMRTKTSFSRAYDGSAIDSDRNGSPPRLWDIPVHLTTMFKDSQLTVGIPHTEYVRGCSACSGTGYIKCEDCKASGSVFCGMCHNNGPIMFQGDLCIYCCRWGNGGFARCCDVCSGNRELKCKDCEGRGLVKHGEAVTITRVNKVSEIVHKECAVPFVKLTEATGHMIVSEEKDNLRSLLHSPLSEIIGLKSEGLLRKHQGAFPSILKQRHSLRLIPVTTAQYTWKSEEGVFYVYGTENRIYFQHFPSKWTSWISWAFKLF